MSPLQQSLVISGSIFAVVMITQYGRRAYDTHSLLRPLLMVAGVGFFYLKDAPTASVDWVVYGVGALIGAVFGGAAYLATGVERDRSGVAFTRTGAAFVGIWLAMVAVRVTFIALAEHNATFRAHLGSFMYGHGIVEAAIAPFFVTMALVMVIARIALVAARVQALPTTAATAHPLVAA